MDRARTDWLDGLTRGVAGFLGVFTFLNLLGRLAGRWVDATAWWIDLGVLGPAGDVLLVLAATFLTAWAVRPAASRTRRLATAFVLTILAVGCVYNAASCWWAQWAGKVRLGWALPWSIPMALLLGWMARSALREADPHRRTLRPALAGAGLCLVALPLAQMFFFGQSDYRRPVDAAVVFGARAYADGRCSQALADRVATACRLYHQGYVRKLVFSGGPGDAHVHETGAMHKLALQLGVPAEAIILDRDGLNTRATVANTVALFEKTGIKRVIAVSHFYHLPRVKLAYRSAGWEVYTVPARESYPLTQMPLYVAREVPALWVYHLSSRRLPLQR